MGNRFIEKLKSYGVLDEADAAALAVATSDARPVSAKVDLIREGDRPGPVFVMLEGWSFRYKILPNGARQITAFLMPGDCCDLHVGLLAEMDHSIRTITQAQVATIEREQMDALMDAHPQIARAMYISQLVDDGTMRAWITSMGRRSSIERVAHLICELYVRARNIGLTSGPELALPLSQLLLADTLGMTPVHLNRVLRELKLQGAMTLQRGMLVVADPQKLISIAGFDENYLHRRLRAS